VLLCFFVQLRNCKDTTVDHYGLDIKDSYPTGVGIFLFATESKPTLGTIQPPMKWVPEDSFRGKAAGPWSWPLTSIYCLRSQCVELYLHSPYIFMVRCLVKYRTHLHVIIKQMDSCSFTLSLLYPYKFWDTRSLPSYGCQWLSNEETPLRHLAHHSSLQCWRLECMAPLLPCQPHTFMELYLDTGVILLSPRFI
jgi:hypothetical protein